MLCFSVSMASRSPMALGAAMILACLLSGSGGVVSEPAVLSSRLVHRFSDEARVLLRVSEKVPERMSLEYYKMLFESDVRRRRLKTSRSQLLYPSHGSRTMTFGNDLGWLHYTWIDVGTPNMSFLVALDVGSDLLWVPCDCIQCAPLSASYYSNLVDGDLNEYSPSDSNSSKQLPCSHRLCNLSPNCKSPKQPCSYTVNYYTENTSTSGLLVEDILHLAAWENGTERSTVRAPVIIGCGMKQSGGYLDGVAPDGLLGLGLGDVSVPTFLSKAGLISNSFSLCFNKDSSGRIFFGDQGPVSQHSTSFLPLPSTGNYDTYIVGVQAFCIGNSCLKKTSFKALVDTGASFTFLPEDIYEKVTEEFDKRVNATRTTFDGFPWQYCYKTSSKILPKAPSVTLVFPANNSYVVVDPIFPAITLEGVQVGFCLAVQPGEEEIGIIGQNFLKGYRLVFDREKMKLGWSKSSHCQDLADSSKGMDLMAPPKGSPENPLPTNEQQSTPPVAVAPAVAGRAPSKPSASPPRPPFSLFWRSSLLIFLLHQFVFGYWHIA